MFGHWPARRVRLYTPVKGTFTRTPQACKEIFAQEKEMLKMNIEKAIKEMGGPKKCAACLGVSRPTLDKYRSGAEMPLGIVFELAQLASEKRERHWDVRAIDQLRDKLVGIGHALAEIREELQAIIEG